MFHVEHSYENFNFAHLFHVEQINQRHHFNMFHVEQSLKNTSLLYESHKTALKLSMAFKKHQHANVPRGTTEYK